MIVSHDPRHLIGACAALTHVTPTQRLSERTANFLHAIAE